MSDLNVTKNLQISDLLVPVAKTATFSTAWLDCSNGEANGFIASFGANTGTAGSGSHKIVATMEESDTTASADATAVASADVVGSLPTLDANAEFSKSYRVDYKGKKKYARLVFTWTGTPAAVMGVVGVSGALKSKPADDPVAGVAAT